MVYQYGYKQNDVFVIVVCIRHGRHIGSYHNQTVVGCGSSVCVNYYNELQLMNCGCGVSHDSSA